MHRLSLPKLCLDFEHHYALVKVSGVHKKACMYDCLAVKPAIAYDL